MKIGEIRRGKGRLLLLGFLQAAKSCLEEITFGEGGFSSSGFRLFSPDAKHPVWRLSAAVPESDKSTSLIALQFFQETAGTTFSREFKLHPLLRVQGGHHPGRGLGRIAPA